MENNTLTMKEAIHQLAKKINEQIVFDMLPTQENYELAMHLIAKAHSTYHEDVKNWNLVIYNAMDRDDVAKVMNKGIWPIQLYEIVKKYKECNATPYFYITGEENKEGMPIIKELETYEDVVAFIKHTLLSVIMDVLTFPWKDGYKNVYETYVADHICYRF